MYKKLFFGLLAITTMSICSKAQSRDSLHPHCGLSADYIISLGVIPDDPTIPAAFPSTAIETCGKFKIYYFDKAYHAGEGFDDASVGVTRRNTLCSVLTYIQSVYDFSNIPSGQYIRLRVDSSYTHSYHTPDKSVLGYGAPFHTKPVTASIVDGYVVDFLRSSTGTDPAPGFFHADIKMNFDSTYEYYKYSSLFKSVIIPVDFQNGLGSANNCQYDLFSTLLHLSSHFMGYWSWRDVYHGGTHSFTTFSSLDSSLRVSFGAYPTATSSTATLSRIYPTWTGTYDALWADNSPAPYRIPVYSSAHFTLNYSANRVGCGSFQNHVLSFHFREGVMSRTFSKDELRVGKNIIGLNFNSSTFTSSSASAFYYSNRRPWCSKNYSERYNEGFFNENFYFDTVVTDFTITNNISSSLVININADTFLHDDDGDTLYVIPESIINFRGCGQGGNNHNLLSLSNGNKTITYTPRPNFYGRAQFGFNLTDGKEEGTFVIYTIDVAKGNNVSVAYGDNLVLNGDIEEGSEVKIKDTNELVATVSNTMMESYDGLGIKGALNFADCQPYSNGEAIRNSYVECDKASVMKYTFGHPSTSFPWLVDSLGYSSVAYVNYPSPVGNDGNRFQTTQFASMYNLGDSVRKCGSYVFEMDVARTGSAFFFDYPFVDTVFIAFTDGSHTIKTVPKDAYKNQELSPYITGDFNYSKWVHIRIPLSYCSDTPSNILYVRVAGMPNSLLGWGLNFHYADYAPVLIDNVSLRQTPFAVAIKDTLIYPCVTQLSALHESINACGTGIVYEWRILGSPTVIGTRPVVSVSPSTATQYEVTASNGCVVVKDTINVIGADCPCSPASVFGSGITFSSLGGTLSSLPDASFYHIVSDVTFTNNTTFKNANVLVDPNLRITIPDSVTLTLDSAHLFTCPDSFKVWKGIELVSGSIQSARIIMKNNSMIEDAEIAINASSPKTPLTGNIIDIHNAVFNRNLVGVNIENYNALYAGGIYPFSFTDAVFTSRQLNTVGSGYPNTWYDARTLRDSVEHGIFAPYYIDMHYDRVWAKNNKPIEAGIKLTNVGNYSSGNYYGTWIGQAEDSNANLFDNTSSGILASNSSIECYNNSFINMFYVPGPHSCIGCPPVTAYIGAGVYAKTDGALQAKINVNVKTGVNSPSINKFFDCNTGIFAQGFHKTKLEWSRISSSQTLTSALKCNGIKVISYVPYDTLLIGSNTISNNVVGIHVANGKPASGAASTIIERNGLYASNIHATSGSIAGQHIMQGIKVDGLSSYDITGIATKITENKMTDVYNGIAVNNVRLTNALIGSNDIRLKELPSAKAQYGISVLNSFRAQITNNNLTMLALPVSDKIRAVYATFNTDLSVCSNTTINVPRAFDFAQKAAQVGTRWVSNDMTNSYKGFVLGSDIGDQGFMTDWTGLPRSFWGATLNNWTGVWGGGKWQTYVENERKTDKNKLYVNNIVSPPTQRPTANWTSYITPSYPWLYDYAGTSKSILISTNTANCSGGLYPTRFKGSAATAGVLMFGMKILADSLDYGTEGMPHQWMAQFSLYEMGRSDSSLSDTFAAFATFMSAAANSRYAWLADIETALGNGDTTAAESLLAQQPQAMGYVVIDSDVVITDYSEANYIVAQYSSYFAAYIRYLKGTMSSEDTSTIDYLSQLCPAQDGAVVYKARTLQYWLSDSLIVYDDDSCMYSGNNNQRRAMPQTEESEQSSNTYSLYPNPNNGVFTIHQKLAQNKTVRLKVYNAIGALEYQSDAVFTNGKTSVNIGEKSSGVYLVCIGDEKGRTICLQFNLN